MPMNINLQSKQLLGIQVMSLSNSTAVGLNTTCSKARSIIFSVETNDARVRFDSTAPALTTGVLFQSDDTYAIEGYDLANIKFQRSTGTCKITLAAWKNRNDKDR